MFVEVPALDGTANAVSFNSVNFPTKYLGLLPAGAEEAGRMGLIDVVTPAAKASASFKKVAGLSDPTGWSFESTTTPGSYMMINNHLQGGCSGGCVGVHISLLSKNTFRSCSVSFKRTAHIHSVTSR